MSNEDKLAEQVFNKMMQADFCSQWMKIEPISIKAGYCKIKMEVQQQMLNGFGILHGGIAYAFADSAFAFASNSHGRLSVSINGSMNFAKSAKLGDALIAEAKALNINYKTADFDVEVYTENPKTVHYYFRGTVYRSSKLVLEQ